MSHFEIVVVILSMFTYIVYGQWHQRKIESLNYCLFDFDNGKGKRDFNHMVFVAIMFFILQIIGIVYSYMYYGFKGILFVIFVIPLPCTIAMYLAKCSGKLFKKQQI